MTYSDAYVGHYLESAIQGLGLLIPLLWFTIDWTFMVALLLVNIRGMMRHDIRCIWLIGNHHILHHKYPRYNFGEYWLDYLGGTQCPHINEYKTGLIYL
jgi:sterol desaturase/sphingolipid hydroxylase (fatty acid hydroxylase superfamily)